MFRVKDAIFLEEVLGVITLLASDDTEALDHGNEIKSIHLVHDWLDSVALEHINQTALPVVHSLPYLDEEPRHLHKLYSLPFVPKEELFVNNWIASVVVAIISEVKQRVLNVRSDDLPVILAEEHSHVANQFLIRQKTIVSLVEGFDKRSDILYLSAHGNKVFTNLSILVDLLATLRSVWFAS
jgi:hypothetical protein